MRVSDDEVAQVMRDTGMERMQAYRHVEGRNILRERANRPHRIRDERKS